ACVSVPTLGSALVSEVSTPRVEAARVVLFVAPSEAVLLSVVSTGAVNSSEVVTTLSVSAALVVTQSELVPVSAVAEGGSVVGSTLTSPDVGVIVVGSDGGWLVSEPPSGSSLDI